MRIARRVGLVLVAAGGAFLPAASRAQWATDGVPVCAAASHQLSPAAAPDGAGGAILVWADRRNGSAGDIFAQHLDRDGYPLWAADGVPVCTEPADQSFPSILADGSGGAIIGWIDARNFGTTGFDLYVQRLDGSGTRQWTADGVPLVTATGGQHYPRMASDGAGGAVVVWDDYRAGSMNGDVYAARVTSGGVVPDSTGIAVSAGPGGEGTPSLVADGNGGAIIAWSDGRNGADDIYAARLSGAGVVLDPAGIPLCLAAGSQYYPACVSDGAGGAVVAWMDVRSEAAYAQRVDAAGAARWTADGVPLGPPLGSSVFTMPRILPDGAGGAIVAWPRFDASNLNLYAQRVDADGTPVWEPGPVPVCTASGQQNLGAMVPDHAGGVVIAWEDARVGSFDVYAQRLDSAGVAAWTPNGMVVCAAGFGQQEIVAVADEAGGAIIAWKDNRLFLESDIYAQRVRDTRDTAAPDRSAPRAAFTLLPPSPNPFRGSTHLDLYLERPSDVAIDVFDAAGRRVRGRRLPSQGAGWQRVAIDGQDETGSRLPGGVYLCRVTALGSGVTRKIVLVD
jgi:hypothetical protein